MRDIEFCLREDGIFAFSREEVKAWLDIVPGAGGFDWRKGCEAEDRLADVLLHATKK